MNKICTTIEQSKKLVELGLDVKTADMSYSSIHNIGQEVSYCNVPLYTCPMADDIPAWSLNSLLNIIKNRKDCNKVEFFSNYSSKWVLATTYYNSVWKEKEIIAEYPIDAAVEMVYWLLENEKVMKLIDKDKIVAEIEIMVSNGKAKCQQSKENNDQVSYIAWSEHIATLGKIISLLDTIEVKEIDINKEISQFVDANFEKAKIGQKLSLRRTAKHFFELGLKAKKGE